MRYEGQNQPETLSIDNQLEVFFEDDSIIIQGFCLGIHGVWGLEKSVTSSSQSRYYIILEGERFGAYTINLDKTKSIISYSKAEAKSFILTQSKIKHV
jgi:hypothetical protein